jgi:hypothetical protein
VNKLFTKSEYEACDVGVILVVVVVIVVVLMVLLGTNKQLHFAQFNKD